MLPLGEVALVIAGRGGYRPDGTRAKCGGHFGDCFDRQYCAGVAALGPQGQARLGGVRRRTVSRLGLVIRCQTRRRLEGCPCVLPICWYAALKKKGYALSLACPAKKLSTLTMLCAMQILNLSPYGTSKGQPLWPMPTVG